MDARDQTSGQRCPQGNAALGIAKFELNDTADKTSVVGLDKQGQEVARLDLIHGRFTVSPHFAADFDTPTVDGRKLDVVFGEQKVSWETAGYEPTFHLPAHPVSYGALAAFLDDPHVKPVLDRANIGFEPFQGALSADGETAYSYGWNTGSYSGTDVTDCSYATTCGTMPNGKTPNLCGGDGTPSSKAARATTPYALHVLQWQIAQCCNYDTWFGIKTCPFSGTSSTCGTGSGACKACPTYPVSSSLCDVNISGSTINWQYYVCGGGYPC